MVNTSLSAVVDLERRALFDFPLTLLFSDIDNFYRNSYKNFFMNLRRKKRIFLFLIKKLC
jgi:imidazoleglycerol phosphate dehydratase HisB